MDNREAIRILSMFTTDEAQKLTSSEFDDAIYMAIKALNNFDEWIPCSEDLPRESENVLIQFAWDNEHHDIGYVYYDNVGRLRWHGWLGGYDLDDVVAWMPLPEPYKPIK